MKKRVCKKQVGMPKEEGERERGEVTKWVTHYSSDHQILLVGEGDFSFSLCLAHSFGSAANIVASSLDSYDDVTKKYKHAKSNLDDLQKLGACLLHGVDATKMKLHSDLKMRRFDRIIFNFPHAGFHGREDNSIMIKMHKDLVLGFFKNASCLLRANGEIHVNHKMKAPFSNWNIEKLAIQSILTLIERADFKKEDYPGYNNKRGDSYRCDEPFPLGKCSTFKFIYNPRALGKHKRRNHMDSRQERDLPFQEIQEAVKQLPTSVDLNYYPQTSHFSKLNEALTSIFGLRNGYTPISGGYLNNAAVVHGRAAPCAGYSAHGMSLGSQRSLQPLQPMQSLQSLQPMESLQSLQPWPTSTNVRYSQTDHVRIMDIVPLSLGARNEGNQVFGGSSNYLQEALGRTFESAGHSFDRVRPDFEGYIAEVPRRTLNGDIYVQSELHRMNILRSERRILSLGARNEGYQVFGGSSNYLQEATGRTFESAGYSFDRVRHDFERYIAEVPRRTLNGDIYVQSELHRMNILRSERRMFVES